MAIKLYRCKNLWVKAGGHPCWRVQSALDEQGIEYELVTGAWPAIGKRHDIEKLSGQTKYPVIQFEDGSVYREESKDMAETIMAGKLFDKQGAQRPRFVALATLSLARGYSSVGRAPGSHPGGRRFESG